MKLWVLDKQGNCLFNYKDGNDSEVCERCLTAVLEGECARSRYAIHKSTELNEFRFCFDRSIKGKQARFISKLAVHGYSDVLRVSHALQEDIRSLEGIVLHNVRKLTAGIGQKIDGIASEELAAKEIDKIAFFEKCIDQRKRHVARELLSIRKSINQIEFEYNSLDSYKKQGKGNDSWFTSHKAHTLVVMTYYMYEPEFKERRLHLDTDEYYGEVLVDFSMARSAISQVLSNAIKYCKPDSTVGVKFKDEGLTTHVLIEMTSLYFDNNEVPKFTIKGYRGKNSVGIDGQGLGLFAAALMMSLNQGTLEMRSNESTKFESEGKLYSQNEFELIFRKK